MTRLPAAVFVVDISKETLLLRKPRNSESRYSAWWIPTDPSVCAFQLFKRRRSKSISKVMEYICGAVVASRDRREREKRAADALRQLLLAPAEESKES